MAADAIVVRNATKRYGTSAKILDGLDMTVRKGSIYGLLGASGCGKTTLLSCVVGVRRLDSGEIWVLGGRPGSKGSGIPGPRVGYMPQDVSLVNEFTVIGAFYYFGRINGLEDDQIEESYYFLSELFQLPPKNRLVRDMSGGQQRRVSFAAAMMHRPELLILDEPTVGLDPILRDRIWEFLVKVTQEQGTTIVITTHYIDEAKLANKIGLLRRGQLLAESSPSELLARFRCETLEEAFLALSRQQTEQKERKDDRPVDSSNTASLATLDASGPELATPVLVTHDRRLVDDRNGIRPAAKRAVRIQASWYMIYRKFSALMTKNMLQFLRHPGGIVFAFLFPLVEAMLFFYTIGRDPSIVQIAVVNDEAGTCNSGDNTGTVIYDASTGSCDFVQLSCTFLHGFNDSIARKAFYHDLEEAHRAVRTGSAVATMYFASNFSAALQNRTEDMASATTEQILAGEIQVWLDMGNRQIGLYMEKALFERFFEVYQQIVQRCNVSVKFADMPIRFEQPIFGRKDQKYSSFVAPGFLTSLAFFLATSVSSSIIISDRYEGIWDRSLVQGVATAEIFIAHVLTQSTVIVVQVTVMLCVCFLQFGLDCNGSLFSVIILIFLEGFCGMCYGFAISVMCSSHTVANYISTGSFYPAILLCGVQLLGMTMFLFIGTGCMWPLEGMPKLIRWLSCLLPTTIPSLSLRALLDKGYSIEEPQVYSGFLVLVGWIAGLFALCFYGLKSKSK